MALTKGNPLSRAVWLHARRLRITLRRDEADALAESAANLAAQQRHGMAQPEATHRLFGRLTVLALWLIEQMDAEREKPVRRVMPTMCRRQIR